MNPPLRNVTLQQAKDAGYDCCQYKYRGPTLQQDTNRVVLVGNALPEVLYVFDCLSSHGTPAKNFSYRDRYSLAYVEVAKVALPGLRMVRNFPITAAAEAWGSLDSALHCGLIFRRSHGLFDDEVLCQRWYPEIPKDLE